MLTSGQLKRLRIFAEMDDDKIETFLPHLERHEVGTHRKVISAGEDGRSMFMILRGEVLVTKSIEGRDTLVAKLEAGDFFGEVALFDEGKRTADVTTGGDCVLLELTQEDFAGICRADPAAALGFVLGLLRHFMFRLRKTTGRFADSILVHRAGLHAAK
jgi:CRP/FNR family cyclic AMP-dependent transcriptional regulator